jgi:2-(1,2-epoxy-1,2-dihydrophenyl)acetyl-CoA isomerase
VIDQAFNPSIRKLMDVRVPTIAAVNGVAAGAGVSFAMACDLAIAAPNASFIQAFSKIGLVPDAGGSWFLVKKLGLARAMGCALLGDKLSARDAKEWGMIWDVAPDGQDVVAAALEVAGRLATLPTTALVQTRKLLRAAATNELDAQLDLERDTQSALGRTHDYIEGVMAFREKRPAQFKGE